MKFLKKAGSAAIAAAILCGASVCALPQVSETLTADAAVVLTLNKGIANLGVGENLKLTANTKVTWRTSDPSVVTVDSAGNVKAKGKGTAWVTGRTPAGAEKSCKFTIKPAPKSIALTKGILTLGVGEKYTLGSNINSGAACSKRTYRTSSSAVVRMTRTDWQGDFVAVKPGVAYVTVRTHNGKESTCKVTVRPAPQSVKLSRGLITLKKGEKASLSAVIPDGTGCASRIFRSSNSSIVKMTKTNWTGEFTAMSVGTAYVTVRTYNGKEASCRVDVKPPVVDVTSVSLNKTSLTLTVGENYKLSASVNPDNATNKTVTWSSNNTNVATVNNGTVTAKKAGTANITVKSNNGKTATCKVTITHKHNWKAVYKTVHHDEVCHYEDVYEDYIEKIYYSGICANDSFLNQEGYIKDPHTGKISFSKDYLGHEKYSLTPWGIETPWWMLFERYNLCTLDDILNCKYDWVTIEKQERKYEDYEPEFYENGYTKEVQVIYHINGSKIPDEWFSTCLDYWGSTTSKKSLIKSIPHHEKVGTKKVIDKAAYDETVITGYKCSCGATK